MSSSSSYNQFAHLQIPLEEILSATNNFSDENLIRRGAFGRTYRGQLLWYGEWIDIVARRFDTTHGQGKKEFWMEVSMLSTLKHDNVVSIVGFYYDQEGEKIIINKHETRGSLDKYLTDPTLTWMRRLEICVGIARAISYIHYDKERDFTILHRNIKSSKILLDDKWKPKLSGFELSMKITTARRHRLFHDRPSGTLGYIDPRYVMTGGLTHKSDVYSFGVVLFEVLCGRRASNNPERFSSQLAKHQLIDEAQDVLGKLDQIVEHEGHSAQLAKQDFPEESLEATGKLDAIDEKYHSTEGLAPLARFHYEERKLDDMIDPDLLKQMDPQSYHLFSEIAYCCIKEQRSTRPDIHQVVIRLEKALDLQREQEEHTKVEDGSTNHLKLENFRHLEIPLTDIEKATKNFDRAYLIGEGTYGEVYKAELDHFGSKDFLSLEEKNKDYFPKKRSTVAIKRIINREDKQDEEGFLAEIEMLTSCKHPNIVSLLGFCQEGRHMILVYEHASNGSLDDYLGSTSKLTNLTWVQRIKICIDIARGLNYLHTKIEDDRRIIHRDIKSYNILLGENWEAKIADFGLSRFRPENQQLNKTLYTQTLAGTELYLDPEYLKTGKLKNESDIYSFGVVLFEILSGRFANDAMYTEENSNGIAPVGRRRFKEGTIREMVDPRLIEETHENMFSPNKGPDQHSLDAFSKVAYQCVAESQAERPTSEIIIKELQEALSFQVNVKDQLKFSIEDIKLATQNFIDNNLIGEGGFAKVYKGEVTHANRRYPIAAKRLYKGRGQKPQYLMELQAILEYKHENIISLVGYCNEMDERIIVYEYASRGSLKKHLNNNDLTWMKRLKISIDVARGLHFLHGGGLTQEMLIHRNIKSSNILICDDWKAKISDFGLSLISPINKDMNFIIDDAVGTPIYIDPLYAELGFLTKESDIYSFGVVLFEILLGRLMSEFSNGHFHGLTSLIESHYKEGTLDEMVFKGIKEQAVPESLTTFQTIAYQCLQYEREKRPTTGQVLLELKKALELQEDYEIWEPKLPNDYKEIISDMYSTEKRKELYQMFSKGILVQQGNVLFSVGDGERSVMISAKRFSYINHCLRKWRSVPESRFEVVAEMLDISNLKIKIKTITQLLSPDIIYGVYLVFKFCDPRKVSSKPLYVNLKYRNGSKTSHAYFAKWRDNDWMMIELCRFLNDKEHIDFKFVLESFSRYHCRDSTIYVQGIEFRPIDNVKHEEINEIKGVRQVFESESSIDLMQQLATNPEEIFKRSENDGSAEKLFLLNKLNGKKHLMLSAKAALYNYSDAKLFKTKPSIQSRFPEVIELLRQQALRITCTINSEMLSRGTDYVCYLVFKLSEKCHGLNCPVKVRDLLHRNNKEVEIIYFKSPSPWNLHYTNRAPEQREDGWMEVRVWKFNLNHELKNDTFRVNLKLISYEGTMSGLILCGLEFRPM